MLYFAKRALSYPNHNKQWATIISTIKDNSTQQLGQSHNGEQRN